MVITSLYANKALEHLALGGFSAASRWNTVVPVCGPRSFRNPHNFTTRTAAMKLLLTLKQLNAGEILSIAAVMLMIVALAYGLLA
jgi:hypothetical protein